MQPDRETTESFRAIILQLLYTAPAILVFGGPFLLYSPFMAAVRRSALLNYMFSGFLCALMFSIIVGVKCYLLFLDELGQGGLSIARGTRLRALVSWQAGALCLGVFVLVSLIVAVVLFT